MREARRGAQLETTLQDVRHAWHSLGALFGTSAIDASTIVQVALLFLLVALAAWAVPAWRAARTDPVVALRQE